MDRNDWNDSEQALFRELKAETDPPQRLEERTVKSLHGSHLLSTKRHSSRHAIRLAIAAAICVAIFGAGVIAGRISYSGSEQISFTDSTYVLFLLAGPEYRTPAGEREVMQRVNEYRNWAAQLRNEGVQISGVKLRDEATIFTDQAGDRFSGSNPVRGYFLIEAATREKALEIGKSCPHLNYGGHVEVRQIEPT